MPRSSRAAMVLDELEAPPVGGAVVPFPPDRPHPVSVGVGELAGELRAEIARVFGATVLADPAKADAIATVAREFRQQGEKVLRAAVRMGQALIALRDEIGMAALQRGMRESRVIFCGWSAGNLSKMMRVAEFVEAGGYALDILPQNWSTTYELTTLNAPQIEQARLGNLLRPDVTRSQIQEFKRGLPSLRSIAVPSAADSLDGLRTQLKRAKQKRKRLALQVESVEAEIGDLEGRLARAARRPGGGR